MALTIPQDQAAASVNQFATQGQQPPQSTNFTPNPANNAAFAQPKQKKSVAAFLESAVGVRMSAEPGGEALIKMKTGMDKIVKETNLSGMEIKLFTLDRNTVPGLYFSILVVAVRLTDVPSVVGYHSLIDEASNIDYQADTKTLPGNVKIDLIRPAALAYDAEAITVILRTMQENYQGMTILNTQAQVVPRTFDAGNEQALRRLLASAVSACGTEIQTRTGIIAAMNFSEIEASNAFKICPNFTRNDVVSDNSRTDCVGQPIRTDINVVLMHSPNQNNNQHMSMNRTNGPRTISIAAGFIEAEYREPTPMEMQQQMMLASQGFQGVMPNTGCFIPNHILDDLSGGINYCLNTTLLGVYSALALKENNRWMNAFRPSPEQLGGGRSKVDTRNVGGLNVLARRPSKEGKPVGQYGDIIPVHAAEYGTAEFYQFVASIFRTDNYLVSIDCPTNGANSWITEVFNAGASNKPEALRRIIDAANSLTGNNFSKRFDHNKYPIFLRRTRVHAGTYVDQGGKLRDIRDIDLTYVCNIVGQTNPNVVREWMDTFYNNQIDFDLRMSTRLKLIGSLSDGSARVNGFFDRVTFSGQFLLALFQALTDCEFCPQVVDNMSNTDYNVVRSSADFAANGFSFAGPMFNQNLGSGNNYGGAYNGFMFG